MICRKRTAIIALLLACVCLFSCEKSPVAKETEHRHEYYLKESVTGTCTEAGRQLYACSCGESFESTVTLPHSFVPVSDGQGKEVCSACGFYTRSFEPEYLYYIDFEDSKDHNEAIEKGGSQCFRVSGKETVSLHKEDGNTVLKVIESNVYTIDTTGTVDAGEDFVVSLDLRFEEHGRASIFTVLCRFAGKGDFSYNGGLVFIEADGRLSTSDSGDPQYFKDVYFSKTGYDNVTIVGNLKTGLYDVYFNETLVRKNIPYVSATSQTKMVCLRFFDAQHKQPYTAYTDDWRLYAASEPDFLMTAEASDNKK